MLETPKLNQIAHADLFDYLPLIEAGSVDLVVADPPYGMNKDDWDKFDSRGDFLDFSTRWLNLVAQTLKPGGALFVFNTPYHSAFLLPIIEDLGFEFRNWITWDKRDGQGGARNRFTARQETCLYFTKLGAKHTFNADAVRVPYLSESRAKSGVLKNGKRWFPDPRGRLCPDVWHIVSDRHKNKVAGRTKSHLHPTPKPQELVSRIVFAASNPGDVVLDPFMGSGTTAMVARETSRNFLGCDQDKDFVLFARERLDNADTPY